MRPGWPRPRVDDLSPVPARSEVVSVAVNGSARPSDASLKVGVDAEPASVRDEGVVPQSVRLHDQRDRRKKRRPDGRRMRESQEEETAS